MARQACGFWSGFQAGSGPVRRIVDGGLGVPGCDGVDDLTVAENVTLPMEIGGEVDRGFHAARLGDEPQPGRIQRGDVRCREHAPASSAFAIGV